MEERIIELFEGSGVDLSQVVLLAEVGSTAHGIRSQSEDTDYTAVFIQSFDQLVNGVNESRMLRTAEEGERSGPDDIDINVYSLRKFARLAQNGNPSILTALFSEKTWIKHTLGWEELENLIRSKRVGYAFLGYMDEQLARWRGDGNRKVNRPELVEAHGYDTKYASHVVRLGMQGLEYMATGRFSVPMDSFYADFLSDVRNGGFHEESLLLHVEGLRFALNVHIEESTFPEKAASIDDWLTERYKIGLDISYMFL